jgi:glycosyltransferase involved in cell wall biosynthesis
MSHPVIALDARLVGGTWTGDSTYWSGLVHGLSMLKPDLRILLISSDPKPVEVPHEGVEWVHVPARNQRWWSLVAFPLAARRLGAQVVHTQYNASPLLKRGLVTTIHDVSFLISPEWFKPKDRALLTRFVPSAARRASRIITVSETSRVDIECHIPSSGGKVRVTPLAAHPQISRRNANQVERALHGVGLAKPYLLAVGTRWPRKNMNLAVAAVDQLPKALPHRLALTGKAGWGDEQASERVQRLGFVDVETLACLYSGAELFLAPSFYEGFGITLLEAFACGCPVLCSAGGAHPEVAGVAAVVEQSWKPEDWAARIEALVGDSSKLERMRQAGLSRAGEFSWLETARRTVEVYREVMDDRS